MKVKDLYKVDMLAFNSQIGYITNLGTTFYEMQSRYPIGSKEYEELNDRLKLCCVAQSFTIDAAKGIETRPLPKHWTEYQKINDNDTKEEVERKVFENKLVVDKRPEFMKYLYSHYNSDYKSFKQDFELYSLVVFGKCMAELDSMEDLTNNQVIEFKQYYNQKNPILETDGIMNKVCRHMQTELKLPKTLKSKDLDAKSFELIFNNKIEVGEKQLAQMEDLRNEYYDFRKSKQLQSSEFRTYDQFYKFLRNKAMETISSNMQELANLAIYVCYVKYPKQPKEFCWDVFGNGILQNILERKKSVKVPRLDPNGEYEYLNEKYSYEKIDLTKSFDIDYETLNFDLEDDDYVGI